MMRRLMVHTHTLQFHTHSHLHLLPHTFNEQPWNCRNEYGRVNFRWCLSWKIVMTPSSNLDYEDNDEGGDEGKDSRSAAAEEDAGSGSWLRCALQWAPLSRAENTTACSHEEEMRGWERSDSEGGCRGVKCDRPSISVGRRKWASVRVSAISRLFSV